MGKPCFSATDFPFILAEVKILYAHKGMGMDWYEIIFKEGAQLTATAYHAFVVIRDGTVVFLPTNRLKPGDKAWIDTSAFGADGSWKLTGGRA